MGRRAWAAAAALTVVAVPIRAPGPRIQLQDRHRLTPELARGIARAGSGWIASGRNVLVRLGPSLTTLRTLAPAIPAAWAARGYDRVGDVDVVGGLVYAPLEQPDDEAGRQATARFDADTLRFVDAVELAQHQNAFVTVDPRSLVAFSMDRSGGDRLLRYDVGEGWKPLAPLVMDRAVERVQGADLASGAVWLSTDDARHGVYRVDLRTGAVDALGSSGHAGGEGAGIDATSVGSAPLHVMTVDPARDPVWLDGFAVTGLSPALPRDPDASAGGWPPVLVAAALGLGATVIAAGSIVFGRARRGLGARGGSG